MPGRNDGPDYRLHGLWHGSEMNIPESLGATQLLALSLTLDE